MNGVHQAEPPGRCHCLAATAAAVADEADPFPDVGAELDELVIPGDLEQVQTFLFAHGAGMVVFDQGLGRFIEGHADLLRGGAGPVQMGHLVAAVTEADAPVGRRFDHLRRPLVIEDAQADGIGFGDGRLVDEDAPHLGLPRHEEGLEKIV